MKCTTSVLFVPPKDDVRGDTGRRGLGISGCLVILVLTPPGSCKRSWSLVGVNGDWSVAALTHSFKGRLFRGPPALRSATLDLNPNFS